MIRRALVAIEKILHARIRECIALSVVDTRRITPHMLRVSFAGQGLEAFDTTENLHVKLLLPPEGASRGDWLALRRDGKAALKGSGIEPVFRKYTIRAVDVPGQRVDIDFVLHGDGGPGAAWAQRAGPGDLVGAIGPGGRGLSAADWYLIAGDETALPAIGRMMDFISPDAEGHVFVEVADAEERQPLTIPRGMSLRWLHRDGAAPGTTNLLQEAVLDAAFPSDRRQVFAWVAAEFAATNAIRAHLRRDRGLDRHQQLAVAYWRRGDAAGQVA